MLEVIKVIALLCQINGGNRVIPSIRQAQLKCQQEYLTCVSSKDQVTTYGDKLAKCIEVSTTNRYPSSTEEGKKVYGKCYGCHGPGAKGNSGMGAPMLAGQHAWYLTKQIHYIRDGKRTSGRSKMMKSLFKRLSEEEIQNVSKYLRSLGKCK